MNFFNFHHHNPQISYGIYNSTPEEKIPEHYFSVGIHPQSIDEHWNELEKLKIILPKGHTFTPKDIEENIGFSKDYNNFELRKAIGEKDQLKAYKIIDHFSQNPKDNPLVVTTGLVFGFFSQLLQYHGLKDKSQFNAAKVLKVSPYFVKDYEVAFRNYPMKKVSAIVAALRDIDVKSKGVGASSMSQHDLLKEMLIKIFN